MQPQTIFFIILIPVLEIVKSENVLFDQGYIKFVRHGKRQLYHNVTHIDSKIVPFDKHLVFVKTKSFHVVHPEAVRDLKNLQDLFLANCGIRKIEPRAFFNLPSLSIVHLEDNYIKEIKKGVFNNLPVVILSLQRNEIKKIDSEAFDNMPNLFKIKLNSNKLKSWDSGWFKNTPQLTELYFRRNRLNFLPPKSFVNMNRRGKRNTRIFLSKNKLGMINRTSFDGLEKISQLYLDRNQIEVISDGAFQDLSEIDVIYLARNKISEVKRGAFPKIKKIGILDLSSNLLECLPFELVVLVNVTNLEKNNGTCDCVLDFQAKLKQEKKSSEITYNAEACEKN